ncbi:MAG: anion transporter [Desulfosoma sp.]|uniref:anion transporter n=1 Tax=Desulfosoma sp. TaxID=2603217 RepID=UPI004048FC87
MGDLVLETIILIVFVVSYVGIALGRIPGLALDRTGIALLGAMATVFIGAMPTEEALRAIDIPTILLLYGLMVLSAQFRLAGFYTWTALKITGWLNHPRRFLFALMGTTALFSAILANDIVCLAFTPVLTVTLARKSLNPVPFLIAVCVASNIGSAATIIGNPQNMLIGQVGRLDFLDFFAWNLPVVSLSLMGAYGLITLLSQNRTNLKKPLMEGALGENWPAFDSHQARKGLFYTALLIGLFFSPIPRHVTALAVAGCLLCSRRMKTRSILGLVGWHLITLFCSLFILVSAVEKAGLPQHLMARTSHHAAHITDPYLLTLISVILSNVTRNVPAVMLLSKFLPAKAETLWYILAASSTFAGNLVTLGSIANLIVIEEAALHGVNISFKEHARYGIPITVMSLAVLCAWIGLSKLL